MELHTAMIHYIYDNMLLIHSLNSDIWYKFKQSEGVGLADDYTVADLADIFRFQILPNICTYECVLQDPNIKFYMCHSNINVPVTGQNQYPNVSNLDKFEAQTSYDNEKVALDIRSPIVTDEIICLSHVVSTRTDFQRASLQSINESTARLRFIQNEKQTTNVNVHIPNREDITTYYEAVTAAHHLGRDVRLPDVMDRNPQPLTTQNPPLLLMDSNNLRDQGGLARGLETVTSRLVDEPAIDLGQFKLPNFADVIPANMCIPKGHVVVRKGFPDIFNIKRHQWPVLPESKGWNDFYHIVSGPVRPVTHLQASPAPSDGPQRIQTDQGIRSPTVQRVQSLSLPNAPPLAESLIAPSMPATLSRAATRQEIHSEAVDSSRIPPDYLSPRPGPSRRSHIAATTQDGHSQGAVSSRTPPYYFSPRPGPSRRPQYSYHYYDNSSS